MRVGFIGLGSQGGPMARRIVEGGYELTLWARRPATLEPYADTAAKPRIHPPSWPPPATWSACAWSATTTSARCSTATTACWPGWRPAASSPFTAPCIPTPAARSPKLAAAQGVSVIDAPVSGGAPAVEEGKLLVMVGGDEDVVERCRPVFATYADPIVHLGPLGSGQVTKILNNLLFSANLGSAVSTLELGDSLGIPRDKLCEVLTARLRHQQGARQHRRVRRHAGRAWRRSPARCCRRTSATPRASPTRRRHPRARCSMRPTPR